MLKNGRFVDWSWPPQGLKVYANLKQSFVNFLTYYQELSKVLLNMDFVWMVTHCLRFHSSMSSWKAQYQTIPHPRGEGYSINQLCWSRVMHKKISFMSCFGPKWDTNCDHFAWNWVCFDSGLELSLRFSRTELFFLHQNQGILSLRSNCYSDESYRWSTAFGYYRCALIS